jgi:hypothetical protein
MTPRITDGRNNGRHDNQYKNAEHNDTQQMAHSIMAFVILTLTMMTHSMKILSIKTFSITTGSMMTLHNTKDEAQIVFLQFFQYAECR